MLLGHVSSIQKQNQLFACNLKDMASVYTLTTWGWVFVVIVCEQRLALLAITLLYFAIVDSLNSSHADNISVYSSWTNKEHESYKQELKADSNDYRLIHPCLVVSLHCRWSVCQTREKRSDLDGSSRNSESNTASPIRTDGRRDVWSSL